jgi:hypothetical protein
LLTTGQQRNAKELHHTVIVALATHHAVVNPAARFGASWSPLKKAGAILEAQVALSLLAAELRG